MLKIFTAFGFGIHRDVSRVPGYDDVHYVGGKGTAVRLLPNTVSATQPITIDWGNGVEMKYTVDPKQAAYNRWIEGSIEGGTITVKRKSD